MFFSNPLKYCGLRLFPLVLGKLSKFRHSGPNFYNIKDLLLSYTSSFRKMNNCTFPYCPAAKTCHAHCLISLSTLVLLMIFSLHSIPWYEKISGKVEEKMLHGVLSSLSLAMRRTFHLQPAFHLHLSKLSSTHPKASVAVPYHGTPSAPIHIALWDSDLLCPVFSPKSSSLMFK